MNISDLFAVTTYYLAIIFGKEENIPVPKKHPLTTRICGFVCCVPLCGACVAWSTLWRILCCPIQCLGHGPSFMLSNNACTKTTDACVGKYVNEFNAMGTLVKLSDALLEPSAPIMRQAFITVLTALKDTFANTKEYKMVHYDICDQVLAPLSGVPVLPANAITTIDDMIKALSI